MGTRAGYITVDWEKVDNDLKTAGEDIGQKISEQQEDEETKRLIQKVYPSPLINFKLMLLVT